MKEQGNKACRVVVLTKTEGEKMKEFYPIRFNHLNFPILNLFRISRFEFRIYGPRSGPFGPVLGPFGPVSGPFGPVSDSFGPPKIPPKPVFHPQKRGVFTHLSAFSCFFVSICQVSNLIFPNSQLRASNDFSALSIYFEDSYQKKILFDILNSVYIMDFTQNRSCIRAKEYRG